MADNILVNAFVLHFMLIYQIFSNQSLVLYTVVGIENVSIFEW